MLDIELNMKSFYSKQSYPSSVVKLFELEWADILSLPTFFLSSNHSESCVLSFLRKKFSLFPFKNLDTSIFRIFIIYVKM